MLYTDPAAASKGKLSAKMIELHSHLLYGMDDGAGDLDEALRMLADYAAQEVTEIACTPHLFPLTFTSHKTLQTFLDQRDETIAAIQAAAEERRIAITLRPGTEMMLSSTMLPFVKSPEIAARLTLNGGSYILVELPQLLSGGIRMLDGLLFELRLAGLLPILAHPERIAHNEGVLPALKEWVKSGHVLLQANAGHLVEDPRLTPERQARYARRRAVVRQMIDAGLIQVIASDAHDPTYRPPQHQLAFAEVKRLYSEEKAWRFLTDNPRRILLDEPIVG